MDSGIEMAMIRVLRQLPRNSSTMSAVRQAAITASMTTPFTAARTNTDWSPVASIEAPAGSNSRTRGRRDRDFVDDVERGCRAGLLDRHQHGTPTIDTHDVRLRRMAVVDEGDVADIGDVAVHLPSDRQIVDFSILRGLALSLTLYSVSPIFCVPAGTIRF